jgi:hypothetical protein
LSGKELNTKMAQVGGTGTKWYRYLITVSIACIQTGRGGGGVRGKTGHR